MPMTREERLKRVAAEAQAAERRGDHWAANELWTHYGLIEDVGRPPGELLAEAISLSRTLNSIKVIESPRR